MTKFQIALITDAPFYLDRRAIRTVSVLRGLDLSVTVIDQGLNPIESKRIGQELDCRVLSSPYPQNKVKKLFWSIRNRLFPIFSARKRDEWLAEKLEKIQPDVIHLVNPFSLQPVTEYSLRESTPFVYEAYEYWPDLLFLRESRIPKRLARQISLTEKKYVGKSLACISVSPLICNWYKDLGAEKIYCLLNVGMYPFDSGQTNTLRNKLKPTNLPKLVFSGNLTRYRNVDTLLKALAQTPNIHLKIQGCGPEKRNLEKLTCSLKLQDRVKFLPPVSFDQLHESLSDEDVGLSLLTSDSKQTDAALPNKVFDYLDAGLALVAFKTSALATFDSIKDFAELVEPQTVEALAQALQKLCDNPERLLQMKQAARETAEKYNSVAQENLLRELYIDVFRKIS